ncbi:RNA-binding proteins [Candidatus Brocadia sinica JPN1]|uniref:RNA-binding proteins n=1 Tax=Candidatus Brocadia sinica JPN1 TaxID=1197129 RepID=A0ABQ0K2C8_9BACT|nr:RNA-binding proteins [Candidatus Brocadia sinica JPN1]
MAFYPNFPFGYRVTVLPFLLKFQSLPGVMKMLASLQKYFYYEKYGAKERLTIFNTYERFFLWF